MFGALDLASGQLFYRFRGRKRWQEFLDFCRQLRRRFPAGRLYLVCDNYGSHHKAEVQAWCAAHDIELVFTPSNRGSAAVVLGKRTETAFELGKCARAW